MPFFSCKLFLFNIVDTFNVIFSYITLQWYVSTVTVLKSVLLIMHLTKICMESLMKLTSLLLIETLCDNDYIQVLVANASCADKLVPANLEEKDSLANCITTKLNVTDTSADIDVYAASQEFNMYVVILCVVKCHLLYLYLLLIGQLLMKN